MSDPGSNRELFAHKEWIGYVRPVGLVVSAPALAHAQAWPDRNVAADQSRLRDLTAGPRENDPPAIRDLARFAVEILRWDAADLVPAATLDPGLEAVLDGYGETLRPTAAVAEFDRDPTGDRRWLLLVQEVAVGLDLDAAPPPDDKSTRWQASPQARFERLLRETRVPIGLLCNATHLRLVYAPLGETSGHLTFPVAAMTEVAGRPILSALLMLLGPERLFTLEDRRRLPAILAESRKYQNQVSNQLAQQVLAALYELVRGFQAADDARHGDLLRTVLRDDPDAVYAGLLRVLLRLVFALYAEDRSLLAGGEVYARYYSVLGLFDRLRADAGRHPDTMDARFGAWAQLLTLFRLVHDGARHGDFHLLGPQGVSLRPRRLPVPRRPGAGDPRARPRRPPRRRPPGQRWRGLPRPANLLVLGGERLSYRTLDVEQIGSVYETMMGFTLQVATGRSIAIRPAKIPRRPDDDRPRRLARHQPADRAAWFQGRTDQKVDGKALAALKEAATPEAVVAALGRKVDANVTPNIVPAGSMVLQPSDERRRSGSHYTPRALTEPIVRTTPPADPRPPRPGRHARGDPRPEGLRPGDGLGRLPRRGLPPARRRAWSRPGAPPVDPADSPRRGRTALRPAPGRPALPVRGRQEPDGRATSPSSPSGWRRWPGTTRSPSSTTPCATATPSSASSRRQIESFHWQPDFRKLAFMPTEQIASRISRSIAGRDEIREAADATPEPLLQQKLGLVDEAINPVRFYGDLVIASFFGATTDKARKALLEDNAANLAAHITEPDYLTRYPQLARIAQSLRDGPRPVTPFHWEIEFPEVFDRPNPGFDAFVGNPPFMGGWNISSSFGQSYLEWLFNSTKQSHGNCDLVAYFFRKSFQEIRNTGCCGMLATNSISQGDTRDSGLSFICQNSGAIYECTRRKKWPGLAAVIVSVVHFTKDPFANNLASIDGDMVSRISAFLLPGMQDHNPPTLLSNKNTSFGGAKIYGQGFILTPEETSLLINKNPKNQLRIFQYLGGEEINSDPKSMSYRNVINFGTMSLEEASNWPDLLSIVVEKVKPERDMRSNNAIALRQQQYWWRYRSDTPNLFEAVSKIERCLVHSQVSTHLSFVFKDSRHLFSHAANVFALSSFASFCMLQSRNHEIWARLFASSMKDDLRYTPSDCFETFPFPKDYESDPKLEAAGQAYYEYRADLMVRHDEGLTKTYNRFHDPDELSPAIVRLRELHAAMDRAVLDAYGWTDLHPTCEFLLDYDDEADDDDPTAPPTRRRKKPWRYRWPDDTRDDVLARLLELNRQYAETERLLGLAQSTTRPKAKPKPKAPPKKTPRPDPDDQSNLPGL